MTADEFKLQILQIFLQDLHRLEQNNYDARRFSYDGVDRSQNFDTIRRASFVDWFVSNAESVHRAFLRLEDQASRDLYIDLLRFKLAGHLHVRIRNHIAALARQATEFQQTFVGVPSTAVVNGVFGQLVHYDCEWNGIRYRIDTLKDGLLVNLVYGQYFFERDKVRIRPEPGDFVIDGGACTGDTIAVFRGAVGSSGHVYAFDPVQVHFDLCTLNVSRSGYENTTIFPYGLGDKSVDAPLVQLADYNPGYHPSLNDRIPLCRVDDLVIDRRIARVDYIKLDIEGGELSALRGAQASIQRFRPKLAISIYHKPNDFFELCDYIHELGLGYKFFLDHYTIHEEETVLYAIVA